MKTISDPTKIVIIGAGFAGIYSAVHLARHFKKRKDVKITLVDGNGYHLFKPMLHEVASASVSQTHIIQPIRTIIENLNITFIEGYARSIDLKEKKVYLCSACEECSSIKEQDFLEFDIHKSRFNPLKRKALEYDYLVMAVGGVPNFYNIPGVKQFAFSLYTLEDAIAIRERITKVFELAHHINDPEILKRLLTVVIAGAGPSGIELIADLHDWIYGIMVRNFDNMEEHKPRIILVEAGPDILPFSSEGIRNNAKNVLKSKKIEIITNSPVLNLQKHSVDLGGANPQNIPTDTLIWAAGVKGNDLFTSMDVKKDNIGRVWVDENLQIPGLEKVYALGDCARFQTKEMPFALPQTGQVAVQQAANLVSNLVREIEGKPVKPFKFTDFGSMISLGEKMGTGNFFGFIGLSGFIGWLSWKLVYLKHLMGIQKNFRVFLEWFFDITYNREASRHKFK